MPNIQGSLLLMKKLVTEAAADNTDSASAGQVSSIWLLSSNLGSYIGSLAGAAVFDIVGFQTGTGIEALVICHVIAVMTAYSLKRSKKKSEQVLEQALQMSSKMNK